MFGHRGLFGNSEQYHPKSDVQATMKIIFLDNGEWRTAVIDAYNMLSSVTNIALYCMIKYNTFHAGEFHCAH